MHGTPGTQLLPSSLTPAKLDTWVQVVRRWLRNAGQHWPVWYCCGCGTCCNASAATVAPAACCTAVAVASAAAWTLAAAAAAVTPAALHTALIRTAVRGVAELLTTYGGAACVLLCGVRLHRWHQLRCYGCLSCCCWYCSSMWSCWCMGSSASGACKYDIYSGRCDGTARMAARHVAELAAVMTGALHANISYRSIRGNGNANIRATASGSRTGGV